MGTDLVVVLGGHVPSYQLLKQGLGSYWYLVLCCPRGGLVACQWGPLCSGGWLEASANFGAFRSGITASDLSNRGLFAELPLKGGRLNEGLCVCSAADVRALVHTSS